MPYCFPRVIMREAKTNPVGPGDELRNLTKTLRPRRPGPRVPAFAVFVLVVLVASPGSPALAQPPEGPKPQELWRQFPLEQTPRETQAPGRELAPEAAGDDGSFANLGTLAIAVTLGLLLLLLAGAFASVRWAQVPLGREARRWRAVVSTNGQRLGLASRFGGRSLQSAAAQWLSSMRQGANHVHKQIVPAAVNEFARLKETLATYVARRSERRSADEHVEKLKAKLEEEPVAGGGRHPEVEILKAKRGEVDDVAALDEAETLKAKLAEDVVGKARPRTTSGLGSKQRVGR
jgi:hypothetical protein